MLMRRRPQKRRKRGGGRANRAMPSLRLQKENKNEGVSDPLQFCSARRVLTGKRLSSIDVQTGNQAVYPADSPVHIVCAARK